MLKIFTTVLYTLFITIIVGVAVLLLGSKLPIPGNIEMKIVKSGSMEPAIPTGSIVVVRPVAEYRINDVITFGKDTKTDVPTTHRIIAMEGSGAQAVYTTKGDANEEQDPNPVARRDVIGKVVLHVPYIGYLLDFARQPIGFALLIAIPAGLIILEELLTIFRETRKWWKGGGKGSGGTGETLGAHLKQVYVKRRKMDEIFVPRMVPRSRFASFLHADAYGTSTALVVGLIFASSLFSGAKGGTLAYFQDIERSVGNIFAAASCDAFRKGSCDPIEPEADLPLRTLSLDALETEGDVAGAKDEKKEGDAPDAAAPSAASSTSTTTPSTEESGTPADGPQEPVNEPADDQTPPDSDPPANAPQSTPLADTEDPPAEEDPPADAAEDSPPAEPAPESSPDPVAPPTE